MQPEQGEEIKERCMSGKDVNKCDSGGRKINLTALLSVPLVLKWSVEHSSHAGCCRLAGMQTVLGLGCAISSV